ncbi:hypothetical protein [Cognatiyoonia sp. IB215182]|uniref:hypothetical protein n=1 Tax=Cognatiyoonia sp. IB215182 TaxID=3097353 RepID=UPI002A157F27|nr:hypothetical protein [Cognatiyoonia sp. IB215182]MDX8355568.1 hypothetical protein [Cognatiyoonia sp. IB215182]
MNIKDNFFVSLLGVCLLALPATAQTADVSFQDNGTSAVLTMTNETGRECSLTFSIEYYGRLINSAPPRWYEKARGTWTLLAGNERSEEFYENDATTWRQHILAEHCS